MDDEFSDQLFNADNQKQDDLTADSFPSLKDLKNLALALFNI